VAPSLNVRQINRLLGVCASVHPARDIVGIGGGVPQRVGNKLQIGMIAAIFQYMSVDLLLLIKSHPMGMVL